MRECVDVTLYNRWIVVYISIVHSNYIEVSLLFVTVLRSSYLCKECY